MPRKLATIGCFVNTALFVVLAGLCVVFLVAIARTVDYAPHAADERAIQQVLDDQVAAWNRGDLDGFMEGYWHDKGLTFTSGDNVRHGWEDTRDRYWDRYWKPGPNRQERGMLAFEKLEVESLSPTVAIVRGRYVLTSRKGRIQSTGRFTLVFREFAEGWKITSDHTSAADKKES